MRCTSIYPVRNYSLTAFPFSSYCSVTKLCPILCNPMNCSTLGFPVFQYMHRFAQTHVHWVSDAIQPSHPLSPPSPLAFNLSQNQVLFQWVRSSHQVAKVLEFQLQHQSFQWIFTTDFLQDWLVWSLCSSRNSQEFSLAPQFKSINSLALSLFMVQLSHPYITTGKIIVLSIQTFASKVMPLFFFFLPLFFNTPFRVVMIFFQGAIVF